MDDMKTMSEELLFSSEEIIDDDEPSNPDGESSIEEEIKALQDVMAKQGIEGVKQSLRANCDKWKNSALHIAVTGSSGAGKSAFINAIRGIEAEDKSGAPVGVVETTTELTAYKHPKNPNFIVWDMPGVGTPKFPKERYLECVKFDQYDFFMIISKDRFTEEDLWLAKQTQEQNKRFYFIRSHIDTDIYNDSRANRKSHSPGKVLGAVKLDCSKNLTEAGIKSPLVFLVDSHERHAYEFGRLEAQLLKDTDCLKMEAMALSLSTLTKEVLKKKKEALESRIMDKAMEIACMENVNDQKETFDKEISYYKEQFNLDDETLLDNKDILRLSEEILTEFKTFCERLSGIAQSEFREISRRSFYKKLRRMIRKLYKLGQTKSIPTLRFSCVSLVLHLDETYNTALKVYGPDAQKSLVQAVMPSGKN